MAITGPVWYDENPGGEGSVTSWCTAWISATPTSNAGAYDYYVDPEVEGAYPPPPPEGSVNIAYLASIGNNGVSLQTAVAAEWAGPGNPSAGTYSVTQPDAAE
jgi:hypothetical protein